MVCCCHWWNFNISFKFIFKFHIFYSSFIWHTDEETLSSDYLSSYFLGLYSFRRWDRITVHSSQLLTSIMLHAEGWGRNPFPLINETCWHGSPFTTNCWPSVTKTHPRRYCHIFRKRTRNGKSFWGEILKKANKQSPSQLLLKTWRNLPG